MKKEVLECLVKAWRSASFTDNKLEMLGFRDTPLFEIAGNIMDAVYYLLDENTRTIDESVTSETLHTENMSVEECASVLMKQYDKRIDTKVSDSVMESITEAAVQIGIDPSAMIKVILCEWALQREIMKEHTRTMNK